MASWTDIIPKFNPYIQQLPVDAMVKVGMEKQKRYDEGLQKIQTQIEQVAGLDVIRDVDKKYLQSKLNELGNNLRSVAAGDFSNFQLVNSVGGMTKQIVKDGNIQNAVSSTAWYRKQAAEMEKAISEGKASVENIYDFNEKAGRWINSGNVGESFRDRYTPYVDVKKKALETIKALHPKLRQYDVPFEMNADGSVNTKAIADAMKRYKIEGIDENQIKQAIIANLSPEDYNQLSISAKYQFRDVSPEQLVERAQSNYKSQKENALSKLEYLKQQRGIVSNPTEVDQIDAMINNLENLLGKDGVPGTLDEELKNNIELAKNNPDAVKTNIYKDGFIRGFANAFSWENQIVTYETNPIRQQLNWVTDMKFKQEQENRRRYEFGENLKREDAKIRLQAEANALKNIELYGDAKANTWTPLTNETDAKERSVEYFTNYVGSIADKVNSDRNALRKQYTDVQIDEMLADWEKNGNKATKVKANALTLLQEISKNNNYLKSLRETETKLKADAKSEVLNDEKVVKQLAQSKANISQMNKSFGSVQIDIGGNKLSLSPSQIMQDIDSGKATLLVDRAVLGKIRLSYNVNGQKKTIEINKKDVGPFTEAGQKLRPMLLGINEHYNKYGNFEKNLQESIDEKYKQKLSPIATVFVPQIKAVAKTKSGEIPPAILNNLSQLITSADVNKIAADANFNVEKASSMLSSKNNKDTVIFIEQDGDNYKVHLKSETDPKNRQTLRLSKNDVSRYFGAGYVNDKTIESVRLNIGKGNTNLTADPNRAILQKQFGDFPGINRFQVTADLDEDLGNPGTFIPMINVRNKNGRYTSFELSGSNKLRRLGYDQAKENLNKLTDSELLKLLQENYPNFDFSTLDY